jgi:CRP-like cAMP-binding protein
MQKELDARYASWDEFSHDLSEAFRNRRLSSRQNAFPDSEKFEALRSLPFFDEFSDVEIWEVVRLSRWDAIAAETLIMKDGEPGDYFCFLVEGELRVTKNGHTLDVLHAGECFGEMAIIGRHGGTRAADVVAQTAVQLVTIPGAALNRASEVCRMHFYQAFLEVLTTRLAQANIRLATA